MSAIGSLVSRIFTAPAPAPNPTPNSAPEQNKTVPTNESIPNNDGRIAALPKTPEGDKSPLSEYEKLWETDPNAKKQSPTDFVPNLTVNTAELLKSAQSIDFVAQIPKEVLEKAKTGDGSAVLQAINSATQAALAHSAGITTGIVNHALQTQAEKFNTDYLPRVLRENNIGNVLREDNKLFENPAIAPMLETVKVQMTQKYPTASPEEILAHSKKYLSGFAEEIIKGSGREVVEPPKQNKSQRQETDWGKFFGE